MFRDEYLLLEYFVDYYHALGVTHFIMIDNMSEDAGSEYLMGLENINLRLYRTDSSYRDAAYGTRWVNQLLEEHCRDHYCFTVDVDELFLYDSRKYQALNQLIDDMESVGANTVPVTLLDMYPKKTNDNYQRGQNFLDHSPFFDCLNTKYYEDRGIIYEKFTHKVGGVRKRVLGATVCIHKFPFFLYNFYPLGVAPGYHFFQDSGNVLRQSDNIRLHEQTGVLLHFKFIKPRFNTFVDQRITRNEDWDDSIEYRSYRKALKTTGLICFLDDKYSRKFVNPQDLNNFFHTLSREK